MAVYQRCEDALQITLVKQALNILLTKCSSLKNFVKLKRNYSKVCGLFILQNIAMESEGNTELFYKNMTNMWKHLLF